MLPLRLRARRDTRVRAQIWIRSRLTPAAAWCFVFAIACCSLPAFAAVATVAPEEIGYNGLHGYISNYVPPPPAGYGYGVSLYSSAWSLTRQPLRNLQIGLPSTWIIPDNAGYAGIPSLCPPGTLAYDLGWGPNFEYLFQTIEGGMGFWLSTQFKSATPKYRINGTPDCYSTQISSPGWEFGNPTPLADTKMGLVQLSNRLLLAPDGLTFKEGVSGQIMGVAWMALPFSDYKGYHFLQSDLNPALCLRGNLGGNAYMDVCGTSSDQYWKLIPSDAYYKLQNRAFEPTLCLEGNTGLGAEPHGGASYLAPCSASTGQLWKITQRAFGKFHWQTVQSLLVDKCLEANDPAPSSYLGGASFMAACQNVTGQSWHETPQALNDTVPVGTQNWTLFMNASNFKGPVAYWIADTWSAIATGYDNDAGRGLDARAGTAGSGAMEVNTVPWFVADDSLGVTYTRVPRLQFPVDGNGRTVLMQDVAFHSSSTLFDAAWSWFRGSGSSNGVFNMANSFTPTNCSVNPMAFDQAISQADSTKLTLTGIDAVVTTALFDAGTCKWGLQWNGSQAVTDQGMAVFPEYYKEDGANRVAVPAASVPANTQLASVSFAQDNQPAAYTSPDSGAWSSPGKSSAPITVALADGSAVTYAWYRFIDQPALQHLALSQIQRDRLQQVVVDIHTNWPIDRDYLPPPTSGTLLALDGALLVTPPGGMLTGYVPIVIGQFADRIHKNGFD